MDSRQEAATEMEQRYRVKVADLFEGPMDLLIHLIRKNEVNVYDIPIALITDQYLEYLEWMKSMNIDVAGDFLVMAATLAQIKSRMLLPVHGGDEEEDPRLALIRPLTEYLQMKSVAEQLAGRNLLGDAVFVRQSAWKGFDALPREETIAKVGLFELIAAFQKILAALPANQKLDLTPDTVSIRDRISEMADILEKKGTVTFDELFAGALEKSLIVVTFLALLEMVRMGVARVAQHLPSGVIRLFYRTPDRPEEDELPCAPEPEGQGENP